MMALRGVDTGINLPLIDAVRKRLLGAHCSTFQLPQLTVWWGEAFIQYCKAVLLGLGGIVQT